MPVDLRRELEWRLDYLFGEASQRNNPAMSDERICAMFSVLEEMAEPLLPLDTEYVLIRREQGQMFQRQLIAEQSRRLLTAIRATPS